MEFFFYFGHNVRTSLSLQTQIDPLTSYIYIRVIVNGIFWIFGNNLLVKVRIKILGLSEFDRKPDQVGRLIQINPT